MREERGRWKLIEGESYFVNIKRFYLSLIGHRLSSSSKRFQQENVEGEISVMESS